MTVLYGLLVASMLPCIVEQNAHIQHQSMSLVCCLLTTLYVCCLGQRISGQLMSSAQLRMLCRCRLQMLLAALNLLHERLKTQEGSTRRRQAAAGAVTKLIEKFGGSLVDRGASGQTGTPPLAQQGNWQQVQLSLPPDCFV